MHGFTWVLIIHFAFNVGFGVAVLAGFEPKRTTPGWWYILFNGLLLAGTIAYLT